MKGLPGTPRTYWLALAFLILDLALPIALHGRLPDPLPMLWNASGEVTGRVAGTMGPWLLPLLHLLVLLFLVVAPTVDPGAMRAPEARRFYPLALTIISAFMAFTTSLVFAASLGADLNVPRALLGALGLALALIGNLLGKIPKNYVVGIRTPWTLTSEYVWERTHRCAAPLFMVGGLALMLHSMLQEEAISGTFVGIIMMVTFLTPYFHSYALWKRTAT